MADIESVVLEQYIRVAPGTNGERVSVIDTRRDAQAAITMKENANGVQVFRGGELFTFIPWGGIRQVIYLKPEAPLRAAVTIKSVGGTT